MESLAEFGTMDYYGVATFTTGIYRTWFGMYDLNTAMQLASLLLIFVSFFLFIERIERRKLSYSYASSTFKITNKQKLKALITLLLPLALDANNPITLFIFEKSIILFSP